MTDALREGDRKPSRGVATSEQQFGQRLPGLFSGIPLHHEGIGRLPDPGQFEDPARHQDHDERFAGLADGLNQLFLDSRQFQ